MITPGRSLLCVVLTAALLPASSSAQSIARSFSELQQILTPDDYVIVVDRENRETWGRVVSVSESTLTLARVVGSKDRLVTTSDRHTFSVERVSAVLRSDTAGARGAGVYPASWDRIQALPPGTDVTVTLTSGERRRYRSAGMTADGFRVLAPSGQQALLEKSEVLRIERHGVNDPVSDGIVIGALTGAGACAAMVAAAYASCGRGCEAPAPGPLFAGAMSMGAGAGALTGWIIDRIHKGKAVVFPVVVPVVTGDRKAITFSVRF